MIKIKRYYLLILCFLLVSILLVSCGGSSKERGFGSSKNADPDDFTKGTRGIDFKLENPSPLTIPVTEAVYFTVISENLGNFQIHAGHVDALHQRLPGGTGHRTAKRTCA